MRGCVLFNALPSTKALIMYQLEAPRATPQCTHTQTHHHPLYRENVVGHLATGLKDAYSQHGAQKARGKQPDQELGQEEPEPGQRVLGPDVVEADADLGVRGTAVGVRGPRRVAVPVGVGHLRGRQPLLKGLEELLEDLVPAVLRGRDQRLRQALGAPDGAAKAAARVVAQKGVRAGSIQVGPAGPAFGRAVHHDAPAVEAGAQQAAAVLEKLQLPLGQRRVVPGAGPVPALQPVKELHEGHEGQRPPARLRRVEVFQTHDRLARRKGVVQLDAGAGDLGAQHARQVRHVGALPPDAAHVRRRVLLGGQAGPGQEVAGPGPAGAAAGQAAEGLPKRQPTGLKQALRPGLSGPFRNGQRHGKKCFGVLSECRHS